MRSKFIRDFKVDDSVSEVFLIENKSLLTTRSGKPYISLNLRDKSGTISAKVWDDADLIYSQLGSSDFAEVSGKVEKYQENLQLRVVSIRSLKPEKIDMTDFLGATEKDTDEMIEEMKEEEK